MHPRVARQLRVEGADEHVALADRDRMTVPGGEDLDAGAVRLDPGGADERGSNRVRADPRRRLELEVGLEALQLPPEGVPAGGRVDQPEVLAVADDHPRAGAEDWLSG